MVSRSENVGQLIVYGGLLAWLHLLPGVRARGALIVWSAVNLVGGGILTVLPLPMLPFVPEQTPGHYVAHATYALAQAPLLWLLIRSPRVPAAV